jgi:hypothetical protein
MRPLLFGLLFAVGLAPQVPGLAQSPQPPAPPTVKIAFEPGGLVSLSATNVSLRAILDEWKDKGGTKFNGAETLPAAPMTVQYDHRPEIEVMNSLLRTAAGVVVAPRDQIAATGASDIGIVFILATSTPTSSSYSTPTYTAPPPQYSTTGSPDQEIQPVAPGRGAEPPQPSAPLPPPRPAGVSPVAVQVVPVSSVPAAGATPTPTPTPTPSGPGRGGRSGR